MTKYTFDSLKEPVKITDVLYRLITGEGLPERGADKVNGAVGLVDRALGIDTVGTVKDALTGGIPGAVMGILGAKNNKALNAVNTVNTVLNKDNLLLKEDNLASQLEQKSEISYDEKIDQVRKLKSLLDEGILSQDEFDKKKKEILGL